MMSFDFEELEERLKKHIDRKRYRHTKGVEMTAACMAMKHGYEAGLREDELREFTERCRVAGLLHDNAKNLSDEEMLDKCKKFKLPVSEIERNNPYLLHGKVGAVYLAKRYEIDDDEIASAIACHTTGKPAMSLLEKILFVADYIEPGRDKQANLELVRYLAMVDLDTAVYKISEDTVNFLSHRKKASCLDENTVLTRDYYAQKANKELL